MSEDFLSDRRTALEESFFRRRDAELLAQMKNEISEQDNRDALSVAAGISDDSLLDQLVAIGLTAETVAALSLVPLVQVAWADDKLEANEREAVLSAATESGLAKNTAAYKLLSKWLESAPDDDLLATWDAYVHALCKSLPEADSAALCSGLMARAQKVAESAGGILGLGNKVSAAEQDVLAKLASTFGTG